MAYRNLKAEMARNDVSIESLSSLFPDLHYNTLCNKVNGITSFTVDEAVKIQENVFPKLTIHYLFAKD